MNLNNRNDHPQITQLPCKRSKNELDIFRKSQIKESELIIGMCCSRHMQCIHNPNKQSNIVEDYSLSVNSDLLHEVEPVDLSAEPLFQFQVKPEIDMLAQINIKKKQYQLMLKNYEEQQQKQRKKEMLDKVNKQAEQIRKRAKAKSNSPKNKWGHSIFTPLQAKKQQENSKQPKSSIQAKQQHKKIQMKPIDERIAQYKQKQAHNYSITKPCCDKNHKQIDIENQNNKIKINAEKILESIKQQKIKKEEDKKIVQAKIRALQIKALKKVEISKKKPLTPGEQFNLGDSQYSTFSARANNRKLQKRKKKDKSKQVMDPNLMETKKSNQSAFSKRKSMEQKTVKKQEKAKTQQLIKSQNQKQNMEEIKGPFYVWNMPISKEDIQHFDNKKQNDIHFNVDRFNYKSGKTFRQQANDFLAKKMTQQIQVERQKSKQQLFLNQVEKKKKLLNSQFIRSDGLHCMNEPFWNQDEVFKPNLLQNFHFYTQNAPF